MSEAPLLTAGVAVSPA